MTAVLTALALLALSGFDAGTPCVKNAQCASNECGEPVVATEPFGPLELWRHDGGLRCCVPTHQACQVDADCCAGGSETQRCVHTKDPYFPDGGAFCGVPPVGELPLQYPSFTLTCRGAGDCVDDYPMSNSGIVCMGRFENPERRNEQLPLPVNLPGWQLEGTQCLACELSGVLTSTLPITYDTYGHPPTEADICWECCTGHCLPWSDTGTVILTTCCSVQGQGCTSASDCCNPADGKPLYACPLNGAPSGTCCLLEGGGCAVDTDCCAGRCVSGVCNGSC